MRQISNISTLWTKVLIYGIDILLKVKGQGHVCTVFNRVNIPRSDPQLGSRCAPEDSLLFCFLLFSAIINPCEVIFQNIPIQAFKCHRQRHIYHNGDKPGIR